MENMYIYEGIIYTTREKAEKAMREHVESEIKELMCSKIENNNKFNKNYAKSLDILRRLKEQGFLELLDKFVAREDIENTCDAIESMIQEINPEFYVQRYKDPKDLPKGEMMYGWRNDYIINMYDADITYSEKNDFDDDVKRFTDNIERRTEKNKYYKEYIDTISQKSNDELFDYYDLMFDEYPEVFEAEVR